jgi:plastocyanin
MPHSVAGNDAGMRSGTLSSGQTFSHTFDSQGLYNYFCALHPSMTGSVVVEEPGKGS